MKELTLKDVLAKVELGYKGLGQTAHLILAAAATTRLERQHPLSIILIGGPSSGKTSLLMPLTRGVKGSVLADSVLRVDDFSAASLVSHAANRRAEDLDKTDLLPKLKGKLVITKEMAPLFSGHEDDLKKRFSVHASVLDGDGYISASGSHGQRGYTDRIVFTQIGAVTPDVLNQKVVSALNAIGPRFIFWEMPRGTKSSDWIGPEPEQNSLQAEAGSALQEFLEMFFSTHPGDSIAEDSLVFTRETRTRIARIANLMTKLRSKVGPDRDVEGSLRTVSNSESPERAFRYLGQLLRGAMLLDGVKEPSRDHFALILRVALSSGTPELRPIARLFFEDDRPRTIADMAAYVSRDDETVRKHWEALRELSILERVSIDGTLVVDLKEPFKALRWITLGDPTYVKTPNHVIDSPL
jgi:hypothetical protein